jgi:hypothetical protein
LGLTTRKKLVDFLVHIPLLGGARGGFNKR